MPTKKGQKYNIKPKEKTKMVFQKVVNNGKNMTDAMKGLYSKNYVSTKLKKTKGWQYLLDHFLPDEILTEKHRELLEATGVDHMVFPLGITDEELVEFMQEANCKIKRIMHSETQTHIWFFAPDNTARKNALDLAYKLKGHYAPEKQEHSGSVDLISVLKKANEENEN